MEKNYRICRRVYQSLFVEVTNTFIQYINTLTPDEIEQLDKIQLKLIRKKSAPGKFYKQTVQNISYFNKENVFTIRNKKKIDKKIYYWLKNTETNKYLLKRFQRDELFSLVNNFIM